MTVTNRGVPGKGLTIAVLCGALATACASTGTGGATGSGATAPVTAPARTSAQASPSAAPSSGPATCTAAQLTVRADRTAAAGGHSELVVELANQGTAVCTLSGFPSVVGTLQSGATVHGTDTASVSIGMATPGTEPAQVTLAPGAQAWLPLNFSDNPLNGATSCPAFTKFTITPPGVDRAYQVEPLANGSGAPTAPDCAGIQVPPILSASAAVLP